MQEPRPAFVPMLISVVLSSAYTIGYAQDHTRAESGAGTTAGAESSRAVNPAAMVGPTMSPMIILAPTELRADPNFQKGCWVRLFDGVNYRGKDELTIAGPLEMTALHTPRGYNWKQRTESLMVGPSATVTVYEHEQFRNKTATFEPGQQVPDLRKAPGFTQSIDSLKVTCKH